MAKDQRKAVPDTEDWGQEVEGKSNAPLILFPDDKEVVVIGIVTKVEVVESNKFTDDDGNPKTQRKYTIDVDGEIKQFYAPAMLDSKLRTIEDDLGFPARVRIESTGDYVKPEGAKRPMKEFSVKAKAVAA